MLAILTDDERAVMVLCCAQGLLHGGASEVTGFPVGAVKSHISRGKDKIRQAVFSGGRSTCVIPCPRTTTVVLVLAMAAVPGFTIAIQPAC
ncbi:MAG: hypothetical protein OEV14_09045 [Gammaproteobacteria bacterium]|nr:hypothetical protein [Gammaproteobacteria bacterium]